MPSRIAVGAFLHMDVRSDNLCLQGERVVLVDWNWAVRGPAELDLACWLPSLRLEGGPLPEQVAPGLGGYAAAVASYFATVAALPPVPDSPRLRHGATGAVEGRVAVGLPRTRAARTGPATAISTDQNLDPGMARSAAFWNLLEIAWMSADGNRRSTRRYSVSVASRRCPC